MAAEQDVLREYLLALGFRVNEQQHKKFVGQVAHVDKRMAGLGKAVAGVAVATVTMTHQFAKQMERLFYSSRYADTTAANLQALEYGARNIGLEAGKGSAALRNMATAIRSNPGLIGLLNSLGVKVTGRDKSDVMLDLIGALKKMPFYVAEKYANLFGIDAETLFNMQEGLEKMKLAREARKEMATEMGLDANAAAQAGVEYMQLWREVTERAGIFGQVLSIALLPRVREMAAVTNEMLKDWAGIVNEINKPNAQGFWERIITGIPHVVKPAQPGDLLSDKARHRIMLAENMKMNNGGVDVAGGGRPRGISARDWDRMNRDARPVDGDQDLAALGDPSVDAAEWDRRNRDARPIDDNQDQAALGPPDAPRSAGGPPAAVKDPHALFARLERLYALPKGLLDRTWKKESNRGQNMVSPKGAEGHFQFMPKTQDEYGLVDPYDLNESADAAARKWADLLKRYKGDQRMAAAAYNWGDGNLKQYGLGKAPKETRDYMDAVAGPQSVTQETNIHIHGVNDPGRAAEVVAAQQQSVNADLIRNFSPKVR